jgi:hypothetical protein
MGSCLAGTYVTNLSLVREPRCHESNRERTMFLHNLARLSGQENIHDLIIEMVYTQTLLLGGALCSLVGLGTKNPYRRLFLLKSIDRHNPILSTESGSFRLRVPICIMQ